MGISVWPIAGDFAAEIGDVDLSRPLDEADVAAIRDAFWTYAVLVFPDQRLSQDDHTTFARHIGPLETSIATYRDDTKMRLRPDLSDVSNLDAENNILPTENRLRLFQLGNRLWHTDSSFKFVPAKASLLYARAIPPCGGHTEFADMRAAWDALDDATRAEVEGRVAEHSIMHSRARLGYDSFTAEERAKMPPVPQVMVRTIPETGRKTLYVASHAGRVVGMETAAGRALIQRLVAHATQRQFVYTHRWRANDLVMWDNRCTMHRGTAFDDQRWKRDVQRATVADIANTCVQAGLAVPDLAA